MTSHLPFRLLWRGVGEAAQPPAGLVALGARPWDGIAVSGPAVLFLAGERDPASVRAVHPDCHIVVVLAEAEANDMHGLFELGADDVCREQDLDNAGIIIARAAVNLQRRLAARQVEHQRDHLQACLDNLPMPIFFKDAAGVYLGCNKAFENYIGLPAEAVIGKTVHDVAPAELAGIYEAADRRLIKAGGIEIYEANVRYADGSVHDVSFHKAVFRDHAKRVAGLAGAMLDITGRKQLEAQLILAAESDPLTGIHNRRKFFELAAKAKARAVADSRPLTVMVLDLDHFKAVNDHHGHAAGDYVLQRVAALAQSKLRDEDLFARAGGEEFFALLVERSPSNAAAIAERLRKALAEAHFVFGGQRILVTASIGLAQVQIGRETIEQALLRADAALYRAKAAGRNRIEASAA